MCRSGLRASGPSCTNARSRTSSTTPRPRATKRCCGFAERENARAGEEDGTLTTRNILVTNGATQGLSLLLGLLDPRRPTILCQSPAFIGITALMQARGYIVRHCPVGTDLVDWMSSTLSDDVAAIYVNTPHNPTGSVLPAASPGAHRPRRHARRTRHRRRGV